MHPPIRFLLPVLALFANASAAGYIMVREIVSDPEGRIWVVAQGGLSGYQTCLSRLENGAWHTALTGHMFQSLSFSPRGNYVLPAFNDVKWDGATLPPGRFFRACNMATAWNGPSEFFLGTQYGIVRYVLDQDGFPVPQEALGVQVTLPDSMPHVAVAGGRLWAANPVGLLSMPLPGGEWSITRTSDLGGEVSGLRSGAGKMVWIGLDGDRFPSASWWQRNFSSRGLRLHDGQNLVTWNRSNSALPSDTIEAVHPLGDSALLIATAQGVYSFRRDGIATRICAPVAVPTTSLFRTPEGILYVGSRQGLFKWDGNGRSYLDYPESGATAIVPASAEGRRIKQGRQPRKLFRDRSADGRRILR